ncbi:MAG: hypothetical protein SangKO_027940 [Sandaracinaceae bacterium]
MREMSARKPGVSAEARHEARDGSFDPRSKQPDQLVFEWQAHQVGGAQHWKERLGVLGIQHRFPHRDDVR